MRDETGRTDPRANPDKGCPGLLVARMRSPHDDLGQPPAAKITEEVGEGRSAPQSLSREPVYLDRPRVASRVEQGRELSGLVRLPG